MSRSRHQKSNRFGDYWSKRYPMPPKGRYGKRLTHRKERSDAHKEVRQEVKSCDI